MQNSRIKKGIAGIFVAFLVCGFLFSGACREIPKLGRAFLNRDSEAVKEIESETASSLPIGHSLIDLNGAIAGMLGMGNLYSDMDLYVLEDGYIVSASPYTSTDFEYEQIQSFDAFLKENGIEFLYVNKPNKYLEDSLLSDHFGVETFSNRNTDRLLERLEEAGIPFLDLRENIREEGLSVQDLFYRTDHHWTTRGALWGTKILAERIAELIGEPVDLSVYEEDNLIFHEYPQSWLGEQGCKVGRTWVGLDDFTEILPKGETSYIFTSHGMHQEGTFLDFVDESVYTSGKDVYDSGSWHYSYEQRNCINEKAEHGKILLIGDSFDQTTQPFLSLGFHQVDSLILREDNGFSSLREHILEKDYDAVILCYVQFMVGAHDDPTSANYRMFELQ